MQLSADPVPHHLAHHRKSVLHYMLLNGPANVEQAVARPRLIDGQLQRFLRNFQEPFGRVADFSDWNRDGRIAKITVQLNTGIDGNYIALLEPGPGRWHPMHYLLIHRRTQHVRIFAARRLRVIPFEGGFRARILHHLFGGVLQFLGGDALFHHFPQFLQNLIHQQTTAAHLLQFLTVLPDNHLRIKRDATAHTTAATRDV